MNILITGHSKGIGKAIAKKLSTHNINGFSRSNGYDISLSYDRKRILQEAKNADVFINNAWHNYAQLSLFESFYSEWQNKHKTIININSTARINTKGGDARYNISKRELHKAVIDKLYDDRKCRIINISPGYTRTDRIKNFVDKEIKILDPNNVADCVEWCLSLPHEIEIFELTVRWLLNDSDILNNITKNYN